MSLRVLVVDDQTMVHGALAALLSLESDIEVCGQAGSGREALEVLGDMACSQDLAPAGVAYTRPVDVILLDVEVPVIDGIAACEAIHTGFPETRVLMPTTFGHPGYVRRSLDAGTSGFIMKDAPSEQLTEAVRRINAGHRVIDPALAVETLSLGVSPLAEREAKVLRCIAEGEILAGIASGLGLSQGTVRSHVSSAMLRTNARTRAQALRLVTEKGWL